MRGAEIPAVFNNLDEAHSEDLSLVNELMAELASLEVSLKPQRHRTILKSAMRCKFGSISGLAFLPDRR
jgi:hypothetical protein